MPLSVCKILAVVNIDSKQTPDAFEGTISLGLKHYYAQHLPFLKA